MRTSHMLLAASLLAGTATAALAQAAGVFDPAQLPAIHGKVAQYSLTPRGDIDGVILQDGTQVHLPPHLGTQLAQAVKPGDTVTIHGLKARVLPVIQGMEIANDASGQSVVDSGPPPRPPGPPPAPLEASRQWMQVQGQVREPLYGPRGQMNGALLEDGTQIHLPPDQATRLSAQLQPGKMLVAEGYGVTGPYGKALDARQIGETVAQLIAVPHPGPGPGHHPPPPGSPDAPPPPSGGPDAPPPPPIR